MTQILITGASGLIGSHLCDRLLAEGHEVHGTSRSRRASRSQNLRWWQTELTDESDVANLMREIQPNIVYHLAGHASAATDRNVVTSTFRSHVVSTVYVLAAALEKGCERIICTGSLTEPQSNAAATPTSPMGAAKHCSSTYCRLFHSLYGAPVTILRPFMTYGPRQSPEKVVPYIVRSLLDGTPPKLSNGNWQVDAIYVDDIVDALLLARSAVGIEGMDLDLGSGTLTTVREIAATAQRLLKSSVSPIFGACADRPQEPHRIANLAATEAALGWRPRVTLEDGLERMIAWLREQHTHNQGLTRA
jgi:nucleoside-diphosphate-sugar epimerase